jgi:hypothetical protein
VELGDNFPYTFESGEQISYRVCTVEEVHAYLEHAKKQGSVVRHFDDPMRRVVGWCVGDQGRAVTIMEMRDKALEGKVPEWWWERLKSPDGRAQIAERYSARGS